MTPATRQELVTKVFRRCLAKDVRTRGAIRSAIRGELSMDQSLATMHWHPSDYDLHVAISRVASRTDADGKREYLPSYNRPVRYVWLHRTRNLIRKAEEGTLEPLERWELRQQLSDLEAAEEHWNRTLERHRRTRDQVAETVIRGRVLYLDLE